MMASSAPMRDVGQRLLIGLAAAAAVAMGIGYAFIAGNIASPIGTDLGMVRSPPLGEARAVLLDDGRPAFVVGEPEGPTVLDARAPHAAGAPGRLVSWCDLPNGGVFLDLVDGVTWDGDGALRSADGVDGLVRYPVRHGQDDLLVVAADGRSRGIAEGERVALDCPTRTWVTHRPVPGEAFDPSVAVEQEPPGWIWLEGSLQAVAGEVRLCDGPDGGCGTYAHVAGIDPALVPEPALAGSFFARVRDDAIADLHYVPHPGGTR